MELLWMLNKDHAPRYAIWVTKCPMGYHNHCWVWVNDSHAEEYPICFDNEAVERIISNKYGLVYSSVLMPA